MDKQKPIIENQLELTPENRRDADGDNRRIMEVENRQERSAGSRRNRRVNIKSVSVSVLAMLLVLVFFSKTIYQYNLPRITASAPEKGRLKKTEISTGSVQYLQETVLYAEVAGKVGEVLVAEGDVVEKGQPVLRMDFHEEVEELRQQIEELRESTEQKRAELAMSAEKLVFDVERTELAISNLNRQISQWKKESYRADPVSDYDLRQAEQDIESARAELEVKRSLIEAGAITRQELEQAESHIESLEARAENLNDVLGENRRRAQESVSEKEKNRQKQIGDLEHQLELSQQDLKGKALDQEENRRRSELLERESENTRKDYQQQLERYQNNETVTAKADAIISGLSVNAGLYVQAHQQLAAFGSEEDLVVRCSVAVNNNFIFTGDTCRLSNASQSVEGEVSAVALGEREKTVTIILDGASVTEGETFTVMFEKESEQVFTLVPNTAVNQDGDGYFLNQIKRRNGMLGKEFYTEKQRVYIGDSDSSNTVILSGVGFFEPIVLFGDKSFSEGETIVLDNEGDFFEDK